MFVGRIRRLRRIRQETPGKICPLSIYLILQLNPSRQANPVIINYAFLLIR
ncbi:hypothetical protein HMPREF1621_02968 [Escherichia coli A25922R]|uniref:Uncharacterized protein n=1 Tax=Escherichia coli O6:H1 (strain CFT073 / ATCC 700928 / UPEC) TaxID=199310 RepID=A0A0H2VAA6_ECOL6|nr:Hypothetical protein c2662 [Escherichia coli CFT073]AER85016.1 hypothetical protein i02_2462 [Escherichia coli str. 'clone D i2']AER89935.1 hypothetical protein i14_2462 [Escherichia coli str. 'clone D i14']EEJ46002.1 hypothetical protein HMPREF0358_3778 [Escherichia coli 83972]EFJ55704.1 hypothetical protein HMPREF9549_02872 [Escherichia coli MS 185-1]EFJ93147.1 hypothetical protein HMPREF9531_01759 [Escherichia coli MS 45-1]EFU53852.1 hypothetical protein HMPREF9544_01084 [Escherichia co